MIQIRHVPDDLHRALKARAARAGMSLSDYLLGEASRLANQLTLAEIEERLAQLPHAEHAPGQSGLDPVALIREMRGPLPFDEATPKPRPKPLRAAESPPAYHVAGKAAPGKRPGRAAPRKPR